MTRECPWWRRCQSTLPAVSAWLPWAGCAGQQPCDAQKRACMRYPCRVSCKGSPARGCCAGGRAGRGRGRAAAGRRARALHAARAAPRAAGAAGGARRAAAGRRPCCLLHLSALPGAVLFYILSAPPGARAPGVRGGAARAWRGRASAADKLCAAWRSAAACQAATGVGAPPGLRPIRLL